MTRILDRLTNEVELHMETKSSELDHALEDTSEGLEKLKTKVHNVAQSLEILEETLSNRILTSAQVSFP